MEEDKYIVQKYSKHTESTYNMAVCLFKVEYMGTEKKKT